MQPAASSSSNEPGSSLANASPLTKEELVWKSRYTMLESHGYRLRVRYRPDWTPSWLKSKSPAPLHEDYTAHWNSEVIDGIRIQDGRRVILKRVPDDSTELQIHRFLSDKEKLKESQNHTVPLLDEFPEDDDPTYIYVVMPLLRPFDLPEFFSVEEVVDFIRQVLEGIVFMHRNNVAHRDCSDLNIMMDADAMFPKGFHPVSTAMDTSGSKLVHPKRRRDTTPAVRYYFIDFGISSMFDHGAAERKVTGLEGQDPSVPELSLTVPYDPFLVDVYILGNVFKQSFLDKYDNLDFLRLLIEDMRHPFPVERCSAEEIMISFNNIIARQSPRSLRWRLINKTDSRIDRIFADIDSLSHEGVFLVKCAIGSTTSGMIRFLRKGLHLGNHKA